MLVKMNTPETPAPVLNDSDKVLIILSHVSLFLGFGLLLPFIVYLVKKESSPFVANQAKEALNFHISVLIYAAISLVLSFALIGIPILIALGIASVVCAIIASIKASDGLPYRYPLTIRLIP
jgi:uncharacterized protein